MSQFSSSNLFETKTNNHKNKNNVKFVILIYNSNEKTDHLVSKVCD